MIKIGHAITCDTLIISCNFSISHSLTCPKTCGTGPKQLQVLKMIIFCKFEGFSFPIWIIKQNKNNWARN